MSILTPVFRIAFAQVFEPKEFNGKTSYSFVMLFSDETAKMTEELKKQNNNILTLAELKQEINNTIKEKWSKVPSGLKIPLKDGADHPDRDGYGPGVTYASVSQNAKAKDGTTIPAPGIVDISGERITDPKYFYSGCYAIASINVSAYEHTASKGVSFYLKNIQKVADGKPFRKASSAPEDDFSPINPPAYMKNLGFDLDTEL